MVFFATVTPISPHFHTHLHPLPRVVLDLTRGLRGSQSFHKLNLGQELLKRKLTMVGTVQKNRGELPAKLLLTKNRARHPVVRLWVRHHSPRVSLAHKEGKCH